MPHSRTVCSAARHFSGERGEVVLQWPTRRIHARCSSAVATAMQKLRFCSADFTYPCYEPTTARSATRSAAASHCYHKPCPWMCATCPPLAAEVWSPEHSATPHAVAHTTTTLLLGMHACPPLAWQKHFVQTFARPV
jgi:hypothetical protein